MSKSWKRIPREEREPKNIVFNRGNVFWEHSLTDGIAYVVLRSSPMLKPYFEVGEINLNQNSEEVYGNGQKIGTPALLRRVLKRTSLPDNPRFYEEYKELLDSQERFLEEIVRPIQTFYQSS